MMSICFDLGTDSYLLMIIFLGVIGILIKLYQLAREKPSKSDYRAVRRYIL